MSKNRSSFDLTTLDHVARALAEAEDLPEIKAIRDKAEAARKYAQSAALGLQLQNQAAEVKLVAERRAGELLGEMKLRGGNRKSNSHGASLKLSELGIGYDQSARWQREAAVPEPVFKKYIATANKLGQDITSQGLLRLARLTGNGKARIKPRRGKYDATSPIERTNSATVSTTASSGFPTVAQMLDAINELNEHHALLRSILIPICKTEDAKLKGSERRMVVRLLSDFDELLGRLGRMHFGTNGRD